MIVKLEDFDLTSDAILLLERAFRPCTKWGKALFTCMDQNHPPDCAPVTGTIARHEIDMESQGLNEEHIFFQTPFRHLSTLVGFATQIDHTAAILAFSSKP